MLNFQAAAEEAVQGEEVSIIQDNQSQVSVLFCWECS